MNEFVRNVEYPFFFSLLLFSKEKGVGLNACLPCIYDRSWFIIIIKEGAFRKNPHVII